MKNFILDIKRHFDGNTVLFRIIAINVFVFMIVNLLNLLCFLFKIPYDLIEWANYYFGLKAGFISLLFKPWTLFSYMFLHSDIFHILFNMLFLFWSGKLFTEYLGQQKLTAVYFLGGITGGLLFMLAYLIFPAFAGYNQALLIGASAAVLAVFFAIATLLPKIGRAHV